MSIVHRWIILGDDGEGATLDYLNSALPGSAKFEPLEDYVGLHLTATYHPEIVMAALHYANFEYPEDVLVTFCLEDDVRWTALPLPSLRSIFSAGQDDECRRSVPAVLEPSN